MLTRIRFGETQCCTMFLLKKEDESHVDQCRQRAMDCLFLAETATNLDSRAHWLTMSMLWTKLADHAREREKIEGTLSKETASAVTPGPLSSARHRALRKH